VRERTREREREKERKRERERERESERERERAREREMSTLSEEREGGDVPENRICSFWTHAPCTNEPCHTYE